MTPDCIWSSVARIPRIGHAATNSDHRAHWMGLGSAKTFTLDEARDRNREISKLLADGIDPLHEAPDRARRTCSCANEIADLRGVRATGNRPAIGDEWRSAQHGLQWLGCRCKNMCLTKIGNLPVTAIDKPLVLTILERPSRETSAIRRVR